jgi:hypothetical protein
MNRQPNRRAPGAVGLSQRAESVLCMPVHRREWRETWRVTLRTTIAAQASARRDKLSV